MKFKGKRLTGMIVGDDNRDLKEKIESFHEFNNSEADTFEVLSVTYKKARVRGKNVKRVIGMYGFSDDIIIIISACEPGSIYQTEDGGYRFYAVYTPEAMKKQL